MAIRPINPAFSSDDIRPRPRRRAAEVTHHAFGTDDAPLDAAEPGPAHYARSGSPDYIVGYRKPPQHSRFKAGQSGNPRGRPKGARSVNTIARAVFSEKVRVQTPSGERRMDAVELGLNKLRQLAAKGDIKAIQAVLDYWGRIVPEPVETQESRSVERALSPAEEQILAHLLGGDGETFSLSASVREAGDDA